MLFDNPDEETFVCVKCEINRENNDFQNKYHINPKKVIEPCNINKIGLDITKIKQKLKKDYLTPGRMEYYESTSTKNLNLEDGFMEFIVAQCINGKRVGEGHCPIDVKKEKKNGKWIGIDVLCVCLNGKYTNEKSIMQNFQECGNNLDNLFEKEKYIEAINNYKEEYKKKLLNATKDHDLEELYYCAFISTNLNVYLSVLKINMKSISNIGVEDISDKKKVLVLMDLLTKNLE